MNKIIFFIIIALLSSSAWATQYYLDPSCTYNGNGTASTCAASAGASGAFNTGSSITSLGTSSDVSIKADTTLYASPITINWSGTSGDHVTITRYGTGSNPMLHGGVQVTGWTLSTGSVYYATSTRTPYPYVVSSDGTRLKARMWAGSIGATITGSTNTGRNVFSDPMVAGSYTFDDSGNRLYVWIPDSSDPTDNTIYISSSGSAISTSGARSYIDVSYIDGQMWDGGTPQSQFVLGYGSGTQCDNCSFSYMNSYMSGRRGITIAGQYLSMHHNNCYSQNSEWSSPDMACIVQDGSATGEDINYADVHDNLVDDSVYGSAYEINGNHTTGGRFYSNRSTGSKSGIEVYGCYSGTCTGITNYTVDRNYLDNTGFTSNDAFGECIGVGNESSYNTIKNNICKDFEWSGIRVRAGRLSSMDGHHNYFYNNTMYFNSSFNMTSGSSGAMGGSTTATSYGGNEWKNNAVYFDGAGRCVYTPTSVTNDIYDRNDCYVASGNWSKYNGVNQATVSAFQSAYLSATGLTDTSISTNPNFDTTTFSPNVGSPLISAGLTTLGVTDDYNGVSRGSEVDIGAVEYATSLKRKIIGNGTVLRNFTFY